MAAFPERQPAAGAAEDSCFHCAEPIADGALFVSGAGAGLRRFCCAGCAEVSEAITAGGLDDYYRLRNAAAPKAEAAHLAELALFDEPPLAAGFVRTLPGGAREAELLVEGLRCAACAWLVERALARVPGVESAQVTFATRRARVRWQGAARPSELLAAARSVGYAAWPYDERRLAQIEDRERRASLKRLWIAGLAMMQVMMYALPGYVTPEGEIGADLASLMRWAGLFLTLPVITYCASPFYASALRELRARRLGVDVPVALGLAAAFGASAWATFAGAGAVYFDSVTMFVFLVAGGRHLEIAARARASRGLAHLARQAPQGALRLRSLESLGVDAVPAVLLRAGDRVLVRAGESLPADGTLEDERAVVSEALLSGEARPVERRAGEALLAGSVNAGSALVLRVARAGGETTIASIGRLAQRALAERPDWIVLVERASPIFVAVVLALAAAAAVAWAFIDPSRGLWIAISVLIVTCPCALSLATPVALTVATGELARHRFVVARARAVEALAGATDFVFDKTGTLTRGMPGLRDAHAFGARGREECLALAAALARPSSHPLDRALAGAGAGLDPVALEAHRNVVGEGIEARVGGRRVRMGRAAFAGALHGKPAPLAFIGNADTVVWLADESGWIAAFRLCDEIRPEAEGAVAALRRAGVRLHLLTGDEPAAARSVAEALGLDSVEACASPERKLAFVRGLQAGGARVAMVGDGVNDAPALAQAHLAVAMGGGADLAQVRADAVLLSDSLADLARAGTIARRARAVIRQNLAWALGYNLLVIPLAIAGLVTPLTAGIGMAASSLAVVVNALRIRT